MGYAVHIIVAFIIALLSGLGVGGGGLFAVYLALFTELSQLTVQGFNLLFFIFAAGASVTVMLFRRKIPFFAVVIMASAGLLGALLGSFATGFLPEEWLRRAFGVLLVASSVISFVASIRNGKNKNDKK